MEKLTSRNHVEKTIGKSKEQQSVLKRLAGSQRGSSRSTLMLHIQHIL